MTRAASTTTPRTVPAGRDLTLDLTRVACVLLVVFVHILFTGVGRDADGGLVIERTVEQLPVFDLGTWVANIMPLFFVVGGYAARAGWRSAERRGESADRFVRVRLARLARPAVPVMIFFTVALSAVRLLGVDPELVDTIAIGVGSPLWFLAAYLIAQACAPFMIRAHARWGLRVPAVLLLGAFAVDAFRFLVVGGLFGLDRVPPTGYGIGQEIFGIPNVVFVWLFAQQIGFFLFDGWFARRRWWQTVLVIVAGYALLWMLVSGIGYPSSMLANQWPPTAPMAVLAVVQAAALTLLRRPLSALMRTRAAQGAVLFIGSRLMTVYLWHLPIIMVLIGIELLLPLPLPQPGSALWWWTRPVLLVAVLAAVWALSLAVGRFEKAPRQTPARFSSPIATVVAIVVFTAPVIGITLYGLDLALAAATLLGAVAALWLTGAARRSGGRTTDE